LICQHQIYKQPLLINGPALLTSPPEVEALQGQS